MLRMRSKAMGDAPVAVQARLFAGRKISLVLKMLAAGCLSSWLMPYQASAAEKQGPRLSEALGPTEPFASNPPGAVSDNQGAVPDNQGADWGAGWGRPLGCCAPHSGSCFCQSKNNGANIGSAVGAL